MSDMTDTLTGLVQEKMQLQAAVTARDALIVQLLVKFKHTEPFRISQADRNKAAKYQTVIEPQRSGLKIRLEKIPREETPDA